MKFSVIIPVRDRPEELGRCVASILAGNFSGDDYEVIVVENGSTTAIAAATGDRVRRMATERGAANVRLLSEPAANRCRARNIGAMAARGEWLAFTDSDCVAAPDWLDKLSQTIDTVCQFGSYGEGVGEVDSDSDSAKFGVKIGAVAGTIRPAPPANPIEEFIALRRWVDQEKFLATGRRFSPPFAATANLAIRREVFQAVGGFDPALATAGEDADWCWRAAQAGWAIVYAPEAAVVHHHRATLGGLWRQAYHYGIGNAELFEKWRGEWHASVWFEPRIYGWAI